MQTAIKTYTGAQTIIKTLKNLGVDTIFGYPGGIVLSIYDELAKQKDIIHYLVRHEQAAIHAAEGYARVSGKCGVVLVTSGPGATNIVTGLANAYHDGFPLIAITGQVPANLLHKGAFQEVDIVDITKSCTKANFQVKSIKDLQKTLIKAFNIAMSGRKGPVLIDITKNVFTEECEYLNNDFEKFQENCQQIDTEKVFQLINNSKSPLILVGGGAIDAVEEVRTFANLTNIPVVSTMMGLGIYPAEYKNYLGMVGIFGNANNIVKESDLIIAVGVRFNDRIKGFLGDFEKKLIRIDIDEKELFGSVNAYLKLLGDARLILKQLIKYAKPLDIKSIAFPKLLPLKRSNNLHSFEVMEEINDYFKDKNIVITTEVGQHQVWASRYLKFNNPRKFITSGGLGTMGFGFPAAIGASIAINKPVICISGDGSFQMNLQEIATCMDYNIPVKVFILNNGYLGMVRQFQEKLCNQRYYATKISNPDFIKLAQSYGALALRVEKKSDIKFAIDKVMDYNGFAIIDFVIEPEELL